MTVKAVGNQFFWAYEYPDHDDLTFDAILIEKVDLKSRPGLGIVRSLNKGVNQNGELVMSFIGQGLIQKRDHS